MANKFRGESILTCGDGTKLLLIFDANAICEVEAVTDMSMSAIVQKMSDKNAASLNFVRALLYGAAKRNHPMTLEEAGDLISDEGLEATMEALGIAMSAAMPTAKVTKAGEAEPPAAKKGRTGTGPKP